MPNIKSAKKRVLVNEKKNAQNRVQMTIVKNAVKKINNAIDTNNLDEAERLLPEVMSVLDSAVAKGIMHRNTAANKKSGIAKRIADVKAGNCGVGPDGVASTSDDGLPVTWNDFIKLMER